MKKILTVSEFMHLDPTIAQPDMTIQDILQLMKETNHDGFPVVNAEKKVVGIVTYADVILQPSDRKVLEIMETRVVAIPPGMSIDSAGRALFRRGHSRTPVVDETGKLLGLITNKDILRAHIERVTPQKVDVLKRMLASVHKVKVLEEETELEFSKMIPTQANVYLDELRAREYEIQKGLAEPLLIVRNGRRYLIVDGHHRAIAARNQGKTKMKCVMLSMEREVELGMEQTAAKQGLKSLDDIKILDGLSPYYVPLVLENGRVERMV